MIIIALCLYVIHLFINWLIYKYCTYCVFLGVQNQCPSSVGRLKVEAPPPSLPPGALIGAFPFIFFSLGALLLMPPPTGPILALCVWLCMYV